MPEPPSSTTGPPLSMKLPAFRAATVAGDTGDSAAVEIVEAFVAWETGLGGAPLAAALGAVVGLGREHFGQIGAVGEVGLFGLVGQRAALGTHGRQVQRPAGRRDRRLGALLGEAAHRQPRHF